MNANGWNQVLAMPATQTGMVLAVDGENEEGHLRDILGRDFCPDRRPRWNRVREFAERKYACPVLAVFFLNVTRVFPSAFVHALQAMGYQVIPLVGPAGVEVVDEGIKKLLASLRGRRTGVVVASHDGGYREQLEQLADGTRRVGILGFPEFVSGQYQQLTRERRVEVLDLEVDARAFDGEPLPRLRKISLESFEPETLLTGVM